MGYTAKETRILIGFHRQYGTNHHSMNFQQLGQLARATDATTKEELFKAHDGLLQYWRKQCEIEEAHPDDLRAGADLIDRIIADKLAEMNRRKLNTTTP